MKTKVFLDKYDVQRIVAKHYNVDPKNVDVNLFIATEGYGMDEHSAADVEVIVTAGVEVMPIQGLEETHYCPWCGKAVKWE